MNHIILVSALLLAWFLIRKDSANRPGISAATWIPTLWVGILASRPMSMWLGTGGGVDTLDGSPVDRLFFLAMIVSSVIVLNKRRIDWVTLATKNWPILIFYGFLLISVTWTNSPMSSSKRWIKEFGNILVVLVLLSEVNPLQAIRAAFTRCAILFFPLSIIYIRYFPELGRRYSRGGGLEVTGVTTQKNSLGVMVLVCGLVLLWDWLERSRPGEPPRTTLERFMPPTLLAMGIWLLLLSDSKTSMLCFGLGVLIISSVRLPILKQRISALGKYMLSAVVGFFLLDWKFGITESVLSFLGRDMTFTGRTEVWRELMATNTNPLYGTGFMSFWDDPFYQSQLPSWVAFSAHNGYLEIYLAGGILGVVALAVMILGTGSKINQSLSAGSNYAAFRFAIFVAMLIGNFSESNFASMTPLGFLFLLTAIGETRPQYVTSPNWNAQGPSFPSAHPRGGIADENGRLNQYFQ